MKSTSLAIYCIPRYNGFPKGIQRDTGGYAVALAASMRLIYGCRPGEVFFAHLILDGLLGIHI